MILAEDISFIYPEQTKPVLNNVSFSVKRGEFVLFCGPSGCGKSTLLRTINGIIPNLTEGKLSGRITVNGIDPAETPIYELAKMIGTVFQNPKSQFFNLDSESELAFAMENSGCPPQKIRERMEYLTKLFEIQHLRGRNIYEMSGGEKQILAIASVCMNDPDVLVLDEPTANLDLAAIQVMQKILCLLKSRGKTIIIAEHRLSFLKDLADKVYLMKEGRTDRCMTGKDFFSMNEEQRSSFGLRQLIPKPLPLSNKIERGEKVLSANNISAAYGRHRILDNLNFGVCSGDIVGITGKNGSGKSTLFRLISGLQRPVGGYFSIGKKSCKDKQLRQSCCIVMQDVNYQLFGESVKEECRSSVCDEDETMIDEILEKMHLSEWSDSHPMALSGGQKQRLAIAAGMLQNKKIYLFDEPTSGLDYASMMQVREQIEKLSQNGAAIFVITHDMELLDMLCSRCFFVHDGGITELYSDDGFSKIVAKLVLK